MIAKKNIFCDDFYLLFPFFFTRSIFSKFSLLTDLEKNPGAFPSDPIRFPCLGYNELRSPVISCNQAVYLITKYIGSCRMSIPNNNSPRSTPTASRKLVKRVECGKQTTGSFWQKEGLLQQTMTLLQGPNDPFLPTLLYSR